MKITIVQAEIEQAIREYIGEQITIKEGMEIVIDLRSTRGDAGYTADIDISPAKLPAGQKAVQQQQQPEKTPAAAPVKKEDPKQDAAPAVSQGKEEQPPVDNAHVAKGAEKFPEANTGTGTESAEPSSTEPMNTPEAGEQPAESAAEAPKTRTLFTNLKRVNNG